MDKFIIDYGTFYKSSSIESEIGELLYSRVIKLNAKQVLELGTGVGVSGLYIAAALKLTGGILYSYDKNQDFLKLAEQNFKQNGVLDNVELFNVDLSNTDSIPARTYDMVFLDAKKSLYQELFNRFYAELSQNGLMIIDDFYIDKTKSVRNTVKDSMKAFREYINQKIPQNKLEYLDIGDGLCIVNK